jgi:ATP-dependent Lon protease
MKKTAGVFVSLNNYKQMYKNEQQFSKAYYLKEQLREIWAQTGKDEAEKVMNDWVKQAKESKVPQ